MTAVAVCGFPRCGSSMMMAMLHAGGIDPVEGSKPGSFELPDIERVADYPAGALDGHAVKLLDFVLWLGPLRDDLAWKVIWLDRDPREQTKSNVKFMSTLMPDLVVDERLLQRSYREDRPRALVKLRSNAEVLVLGFEFVLAAPFDAAERVARFLNPPFGLDAGRASALVHDRGPACLPDLSTELGTISAGKTPDYSIEGEQR